MIHYTPAIQANNQASVCDSGLIEKKAIGSITATNTVKGTAKVNYQAGAYVLLNPGFKVNNGATFKAQLGGCN